MSDPRIGLVGFFGWGNFGDELFVEAHRQHLGDLGIVEPINELTAKPYFERPVEEVVDEYDALVIGGGDLIIPWQMSELYWKLEYLRRPVFIHGVGVPTWGGVKEHVIARYQRFFAAANLHLVNARDVESATWINDHLRPVVPAQWYPDPVCAMRLPAARRYDDKVLGVVLRHRRNTTDDLTQVRAMCEDAKAKGYTVKHLVLGSMSVGELDLGIARGFAADDEEIIHHEDPLEMCSAIGGCSMLASMKFHGTVVASMYGIPSVVMSATDKSRNYLRMLERPDLKSSFSAEDLPDRIPHFPAPIPSASRSRLRRKATEGYDVLRDAIVTRLDV